MPRRRNFFPRPVDSLLAAAQLHGRLAEGELVSREGASATAGEASKPRARKPRDQARETGTGRFK